MTPGEMAGRIEKAEGPSVQLDLAIHRMLPALYRKHVRSYSSSLDAAVAFVERVLPGAIWSVDNDPCASVWPSGGKRKGASPDESPDSTGTAAKTPAMALVAAALRALRGAADGGAS